MWSSWVCTVDHLLYNIPALILIIYRTKSGMGEPLNNYKNVIKAIRRMNTDLGIGSRHITISTVGIVPRIKQLAEENLQVMCTTSYNYWLIV